jgi:tetratricopeptide (TPR) repeat protein
MKTRRKNQQRGAKGATSSGPSHAPNDRPAQASSRFARGGAVRKALYILPYLATIALAISTWILASDARHSRHQQQLTNARLLLTTQQLDGMFQHIWNRIPAGDDPTQMDRELLEAWVSYDEEFVHANVDDPSTRFLRATADRRVGLATSRLGHLSEAEDHYLQAATLLEELVEENATVSTYRSELADTYARLAWSRIATGDADGARDAYCRAAALTNLTPIPDDPAYRTQIAHTLVGLSDLARRRNAPDEARTHLERAAALYRLLDEQYPELPEYRLQLVQVEGRLRDLSGAIP